MKELFAELLDNPEDYAKWPLYKKQMFWAAASHFMTMDNSKFKMIYGIVRLWADNNDLPVKIGMNENDFDCGGTRENPTAG